MISWTPQKPQGVIPINTKSTVLDTKRLEALLTQKGPIMAAIYLEEECKKTSSAIFTLLEQLIANPNMISKLGVRIIQLWLRFHIFQGMKILEDDDQDNVRKRKTVHNVCQRLFEKGISLRNLLKKCCLSIEKWQQYSQDQIENMRIQLIKHRYANMITKMFQDSKNLNKSKHRIEFLKTLISEFEQNPIQSFEKRLLSCIIVQFVEENKIYPGISSIDLTRFRQTHKISELKQIYANQYKIIPSQIEKMFRKLQSTQNVYETLIELKSKISSLNVFQLQRLTINQNNVKKSIQQKHVLLVMSDICSSQEIFWQNIHYQNYAQSQKGLYNHYLTTLSIVDRRQEQKLGDKLDKIILCNNIGSRRQNPLEISIAHHRLITEVLSKARSIRMMIIISQASLFMNKMEDILKLSQNINNTFQDFNDIHKIAILFKVPLCKRIKVTNFIQQKIELSKSQDNFLFLLLRQSKKQNNYINQISNDNIFRQTHTPIQKPQQKIINRLQEEIQKFITVQKCKIQSLIQTRQYQRSQILMWKLKKLENVLKKSYQINQYCNNLIKDEYKQLQEFYQTLLKEIVETSVYPCRGSFTSLKDAIKTFQTVFAKYNQFKAHPSFLISKINRNGKQILQSKIANISQASNQTLLAVRIFSELVDSSFSNEVLIKVENSFKQINEEFSGKLKSKQYEHIQQSLHYLNRLAEFGNQLSSSNGFMKDQMRKIKVLMQKQFKQCLQTVGKIEGSRFIDQKLVDEINLNITNAKGISYLSCFKNQRTSKQLAQKLSKINVRCKMAIQSLSSLKLILDEENIKAKNAIQKDKLKYIVNDIVLLMKIDGVYEILKGHYESTKTFLMKMILKNVEIIDKYFANIRKSSIKQKQHFFQCIRKACLDIIKCEQIIELQPKVITKIQQNICQSLDIESNQIQKIDVRLHRIKDSPNFFERIQYQYKNVESYKIFNILGQNIAISINNYKNKLMDRLKGPFINQEIVNTSENQVCGDYNMLMRKLKKMQLFSQYAVGIQRIVLPDDYKRLNQIDQRFKPLVKQIEDDTSKFLTDPLYKNVDNTFITGLVKVLQTIKRNQTSCLYFDQLDLDVQGKIGKISLKMQQLKDEMKYAFQQSSFQLGKLEDLEPIFKFYKVIEDQLGANRFGIKKDIYETCRKQFSKVLQQNKTDIENMFKDKSICYLSLKEYYQQSLSWNYKYGQKLRQVIISQMKIVEKKIQRRLKQLERDLWCDSTYLRSTDNVNEFVNALSQALNLINQLQKLYSLSQDRNRIIIKQSDVFSIVSKIVNDFNSTYHRIQLKLQNYNTQFIYEDITQLQSLELSLKKLQMHIIGQNNSFIRDHLKFVEEMVRLAKQNLGLRKKYINSQEAVRRTNNLSKLCLIYAQSIDVQTNIRCTNHFSEFQIDHPLLKLVQNCAREKKVILMERTSTHMESLIEKIDTSLQQLLSIDTRSQSQVCILRQFYWQYNNCQQLIKDHNKSPQIDTINQKIACRYSKMVKNKLSLRQNNSSLHQIKKIISFVQFLLCQGLFLSSQAQLTTFKSSLEKSIQQIDKKIGNLQLNQQQKFQRSNYFGVQAEVQAIRQEIDIKPVLIQSKFNQQTEQVSNQNSQLLQTLVQNQWNQQEMEDNSSMMECIFVSIPYGLDDIKSLLFPGLVLKNTYQFYKSLKRHQKRYIAKFNGVIQYQVIKSIEKVLNSNMVQKNYHNNEKIFKFLVQLGDYNYPRFHSPSDIQRRQVSFTTKEYKDYFQKHRWMIWPLLKSIANFMVELQQLGIYHADIFLRNIIKVSGQNWFKLIDKDYAFQFRYTKIGMQNLQITRQLFKRLINARKQDQQDIIRFMFPCYRIMNQWRPTQQLVKDILSDESSEEAKINNLLITLQMHARRSHLEQFLNIMDIILEEQLMDNMKPAIDALTRNIKSAGKEQGHAYRMFEKDLKVLQAKDNLQPHQLSDVQSKLHF